MKKLFTIIGVAALVLAAVSFTALAQPTPVYNGGTPILLSGINGGVPGFSTIGTTNVLMGTNYTIASAPVIGALKQRYIAITETHSSIAAGSTNTYLFAPSVDGINYDTNAANDITFVAKNTIGLGPVTTVTNWDSGGYGYYKLISVSTNNPATNVLLNYSIKIGAP